MRIKLVADTYLEFLGKTAWIVCDICQVKDNHPIPDVNPDSGALPKNQQQEFGKMVEKVGKFMEAHAHADAMRARMLLADSIIEVFRAARRAKEKAAEELMEKVKADLDKGEGHGHVVARKDGSLVRCDGLGLCDTCNIEAGLVADAKERAGAEAHA